MKKILLVLMFLTLFAVTVFAKGIHDCNEPHSHHEHVTEYYYPKDKNLKDINSAVKEEQVKKRAITKRDTIYRPIPIHVDPDPIPIPGPVPSDPTATATAKPKPIDLTIKPVDPTVVATPIIRPDVIQPIRPDKPIRPVTPVPEVGTWDFIKVYKRGVEQKYKAAITDGTLLRVYFQDYYILVEDEFAFRGMDIVFDGFWGPEYEGMGLCACD